MLWKRTGPNYCRLASARSSSATRPSAARSSNRRNSAQVHRIAALGKSGGTLDYVAAWFIRAGEYVKGSNARIGFVATNSITQGEQVAQLWPVLFGRSGLQIAYAHRTFAWGSDARGKARFPQLKVGRCLVAVPRKAPRLG